MHSHTKQQNNSYMTLYRCLVWYEIFAYSLFLIFFLWMCIFCKDIKPLLLASH